MDPGRHCRGVLSGDSHAGSLLAAPLRRSAVARLPDLHPCLGHALLVCCPCRHERAAEQRWRCQGKHPLQAVIFMAHVRAPGWRAGGGFSV